MLRIFRYMGKQLKKEHFCYVRVNGIKHRLLIGEFADVGFVEEGETGIP